MADSTLHTDNPHVADTMTITELRNEIVSSLRLMNNIVPEVIDVLENSMVDQSNRSLYVKMCKAIGKMLADLEMIEQEINS